MVSVSCRILMCGYSLGECGFQSGWGRDQSVLMTDWIVNNGICLL